MKINVLPIPKLQETLGRAGYVLEGLRVCRADGRELSPDDERDVKAHLLAWALDEVQLLESPPAPEDPKLVHCECGETCGGRCDWKGPKSDIVVVEWMPQWLRDSHVAAGYDSVGTAGRYPYNGAEHLRCSRECAERMVDNEDGWARVLE